MPLNLSATNLSSAYLAALIVLPKEGHPFYQCWNTSVKTFPLKEAQNVWYFIILSVLRLFCHTHSVSYLLKDPTPQKSNQCPRTKPISLSWVRVSTSMRNCKWPFLSSSFLPWLGMRDQSLVQSNFSLTSRRSIRFSINSTFFISDSPRWTWD